MAKSAKENKSTGGKPAAPKNSEKPSSKPKKQLEEDDDVVNVFHNMQEN